MLSALSLRKTLRLWLVCGLAVLVNTVSSFAQSATVNHNANLRQGPGSSFATIRTLMPGEVLTVLSLTPTSSYYNVGTTQGEQGWVYRNYIDIDEAVNSGHIDHNANLRSGPSTSQSVIRC